MKGYSKVLILMATVLLTSVTLWAQGPGFDDDVEDTPLDGGASFLAAAAAGYGAKKLRDRKKKKGQQVQ